MTSPTPVLIRVVLADDHVVVRAGIRQFLEQNGDIQVIAEAANGQEACDLVLQHRPDVAILDIQMPKMDGLEAARLIRTNLPAERQPMIIALTAHASEDDRLRCIESGMDDYLTKPINRKLLTETLQSVSKKPAS